MNENVNVCITPKGDKPILHFSQFDNERIFTVTVLADDGESAAVLTGLDIEFRLRKTDSHVVTIAPESVADNVITFKTTEQLCACCGQNIASVVLMKDDMNIATLDILVDIQRDILSGGLTSESDIRNLTTQIEQIVPEVVGDDYYTKTEVDELIAEIPTFDPSNYYTKDDVYTKSDVYNKIETDNLLSAKMDNIGYHGVVDDAAVISFITDCNAPLDIIKGKITPVQDLHGYSKPWSGGGGKNKLDYLSNLRATDSGLTISATSGGAIHYQGTAINNYCMLTYKFNLSIPSGTTITVSRDVSVGYQHYFSFTFTDNSIEYVRIMPNTTSTTYILPKDLKNIDIVCLGLAVGTAYNATVKFQLEYGSQATSWEPYSNICPISGFSALNVTLADGDMQTVDTKTVNFGQTVYGGVADVTNGKVNKTYGYAEFNGSENWINVGGNYPFAFQLDTGIQDQNSGSYTTNLSSLFPWTLEAAPSTNAMRWQSPKTSNGRLYVYDYTHISDLAGFKAMLANTPLQICYELDNPIEITTTPETVSSIAGDNNIFLDTGNLTEIAYFENAEDNLIKLIKACQI